MTAFAEREFAEIQTRNEPRKEFATAGAALLIAVSLNGGITDIGPPLLEDSDHFSIVVLSDTQYYSAYNPQIFKDQTEWIVKQANVEFVIHLGDIVEDSDDQKQWEAASKAMEVLDDNGIAYAVLPGNHDMKGDPLPIPGASAPLFEQYFPASRYEESDWWGGSFDSKSVESTSPNMNNYQLFSSHGTDFITLNLQFNPPLDVLEWANEVLTENSARKAIVSTHSYLDTDGEWSTGGQDIWDGLIAMQSNVFLVLCGHKFGMFGFGAYEKTDIRVDGSKVVSVMFNYQNMSEGEEGLLRILEFDPESSTSRVMSYSPYSHQRLKGGAHEFEISY
jgi:predicted phosphodiesterase